MISMILRMIVGGQKNLQTPYALQGALQIPPLLECKPTQKTGKIDLLQKI